MIQKLKAPGGRPGAAMRRGAEAFASTHIVPQPAKNCKPPGHLTPGEAELWLEAERSRATDYQRFCDLRRALLLAQTARWINYARRRGGGGLASSPTPTAGEEATHD